MDFLNQLDHLVINNKGKFYLSKDSRLSSDVFNTMYPEHVHFKKVLEKYNPDSKFSSLLSSRLALTKMKKRVLILGANSDIAKPCAVEFYKDGYEVILASRNIEELNKFAKESIPNAVVLEFDATKTSTHEQFLASIETPDVVVVAFGLLYKNEKSLARTDAALEVINTNFTGAVSIIGGLVAKFEERGSGTIIGISSVAAIRGRASNVIYCASKAGFDSYLSGLRNKYAKTNIKIISVRPGYVKTKMLGKLETPNFLTADPQKLGKRIFSLKNSNRSVVYYKPIWRTVMLVIRLIPEPIFKKMKL